MPDEIANLLKVLYERNEHYHDVKERVVWLAGVVYLTFSVALMAWYLQNCDTICSLLPGFKNWHGAAFLSAIFALTATFILRQTWEKVRSAVKTAQFNDLIRDLPNLRNHAALMNANDYKKKKPKSIWDFISIGWSGHLILGVVYSFFVAQLIALCRVPRCWIWLSLLFLPAALSILLPPLVSWRISKIKQAAKP